MEPVANERGRQTTYSIRRGDFSKVILATCSRGMSKNRPKLGIFGSRLNAQVSYGHGSGGKWKRTSNYIFYQEVDFFQGHLSYMVQGWSGFPIVKLGICAQPRKLQGGKTDIMSHGSSHRHAMDMEPVVYDRRSHSLYSIRRLNFFMVILATWGRRMCQNRPKFKGFQPRNQPNLTYMPTTIHMWIARYNFCG
jgi:hypothetical protein